MRRILALVPITFLAACPGHTRLSPVEQSRLAERLEKTTRQLAVTMYTGPFFRDARYRLLADQPPEHLNLLNDPRGRPISPGVATGIVPAGTRVHVRAVELPTAGNVTTRSLMTPRHFTWVLLDVPGFDRPHVLVVRDDPETHEAFLALVEPYLTERDVAAELAALPEEVQAAVAEKRVTQGMTEAAARLAWGNPLIVHLDREAGVPLVTWTFEGGRTLLLRDGIVEAFAEPTTPPPSP